MIKKSCYKIVIIISVALSILFFGYPEVFAADKYGAIAYSRSTGGHGYSYDYSTRAAAEARAIRECRRQTKAGDCYVLVWFRNGCGALAKGSNGYGSGWGTYKSLAKQNAIKSCSRNTYNCRVVRWVCTSR